jgi:FlgO protein
MKNALAAALLLFAACAPAPQKDFVDLRYEAADVLLHGARGELPDDATIIYGVFTPVGQPGTSEPFGRMFAELVASRLVQNGVGVVEVRLRDAIAVREGGPGWTGADRGF